jgi:hypothetical protein
MHAVPCVWELAVQTCPLVMLQISVPSISISRVLSGLQGECPHLKLKAMSAILLIGSLTSVRHEKGLRCHCRSDHNKQGNDACAQNCPGTGEHWRCTRTQYEPFYMTEEAPATATISTRDAHSAVLCLLASALRCNGGKLRTQPRCVLQGSSGESGA